MLYNMFIVNTLCTFKGQICIPQTSLFLFVKISRKVLHFVTFCYIFREAFILFVVLCHRSTWNRSKVERRTSTPDFAALLPVFLPLPGICGSGPRPHNAADRPSGRIGHLYGPVDQLDGWLLAAGGRAIRA